jgi:hypothetical protein
LQPTGFHFKVLVTDFAGCYVCVRGDAIMKNRISFALAIATIALAALAIPASAQNSNCVKSCTMLKNGCISGGGNPSACSAGYEDCKKTGTYGGMPSGKTWTNICKK